MYELKERFVRRSFKKLVKIDNPELHKFVKKYILLCNPDKIFVNSGTTEDIKYIKRRAIELAEEKELKIKGHTVHFDGYYDQARDKQRTKILLQRGENYGKYINWIEREKGLKEIHKLMNNIMKGKELYICFYSLGPVGSEFSILAVQLTDSAYVAHSENILYRQAYDEFLRKKQKAEFFRFVHSAGKLDKRKNSKNIDKRRIYIDLLGNTVYSVNTQYGGNTIGLKKLAMRLAIHKASKEGWLTEHMLIIGINGPNNRVSYIAGAFPSLCGKTSTAMMPGERLIGDDIAYLHKKNGKVYAVNVEKGMFGIIEGINSKDDPIIFKALHSAGDIIFSNVLVTEDGEVYWVGKDMPKPKKGINYSGKWYEGKKDKEGNEIPVSHPNARFTIALDMFENLDPQLENPEGVEIGGIVYGGRDSDTWVPVEEAFNWVHGVITKAASLESETTAATLGINGVRKFNLMSNLDFLSVSIGKYIQMHLDFAKNLKEPPKIFSVNYFLRDRNGNFLNDKTDKRIWYKWMELRIHNDVKAVKTPTGYIPKYEDLKQLFERVLNKNYLEEDYAKQFTIRIPEHLAKIERIVKIYKEIPDTPKIVFEVLDRQKKRLLKMKERKGDYVSPFDL
ncbi:MAG: phosphoenolpyruvate carboxykinase (GTP) [Candidatus Diapherotrites archaeon]|nr:phosphoenolpyruvate carboxykinase (GTP) [Candidatus Diapherotrites archaeon]